MGGNRTNQGLAILRSVLSAAGITRFGNNSAFGATSAADPMARESIAAMTSRTAVEHYWLASSVTGGSSGVGDSSGSGIEAGGASAAATSASARSSLSSRAAISSR